MSSIQLPTFAVMVRSSPDKTRSMLRTPSAVGPQQLLNKPPSASTVFTWRNHSFRYAVYCGTLDAPSSPPNLGSVRKSAMAASMSSTCG